MTSHSPGPWRVDLDIGREPLDATGAPIIAGNAFEVRNEADLRLIAAAPEMLELLRMAGRVLDGDANGEAWRDQWDSLLARIEGKAP